MSEASEPCRQIPHFAAKIKEILSKPGEPAMVSVVSNFRAFIWNQYCEISDQTTPKEYLYFLWERIQNAKLDSEVELIMIGEIKQIHIGTKMQRAEFLQDQVLRVPTVTNDLTWYYFEKLVAWTANHSLEKRTQAFMRTFMEILEKAISNEHSSRASESPTKGSDSPMRGSESSLRSSETSSSEQIADPIMIGLRILCLFARRFRASLENNGSLVVPLLQAGIASLDPDSLLLVKRTLHVLQSEHVKLGIEWPKVFMVISNHFDKWISLGGAPPGPQFQYVCEIAEKLVEISIDCTRVLKFSPPLHQLLMRREANLRNVVFAIYPLYLQQELRLRESGCHLDDMTEEVTVATLKAFKSLVKKKAAGRNEALFGLANYLFARAKYGELKCEGSIGSVLQKLRKKVEAQVDGDPALYCLGILIAVTEQHCSHSYGVFEKAPLSLTLVEAFKKMCEIRVDERPFFCKKVLSVCMEKLLNDHIPANEAIMAFRCLEKMEVPIPKGSVSLILQLSVWMSHPDKVLKQLATDVVMKYQDEWPSFEVFQRVLSVISTEANSAKRAELLRRVKKEPFDARAVAIMQSLVHDPARYVRNESLRILSAMAYIPEAAQKVSEFLAEKVRDMTRPGERTKDSIECFTIVADAVFSNGNAHVSNSTKRLLVPVAQFLVRHLLETQAASTNAIRLLAQLMPLAPNSVNLKQLTTLIGSVLSIHSTATRADAAINLFQVALDSTNLKCTIYTEHLDLMAKLLALARSQTFSGSKFLKVLTSIGAIDPQMVRSFDNNSPSSEEDSGVSNTPNTYIANFDPNHFSSLRKPSEGVADDKKSVETPSDMQPRLESLCSASVGVALLNLLDILSEESLSGLHADAIEAILKIFRAHRRQIGDSLEAELFKRFTQMIQANGASTISVLIKNMTTLMVMLGDRFVPLVPSVVNLVCQKWGKGDDTHLTRILNWMIIYLPEALEPHIPRIASLIVKTFESCDAATLNGIFLGLDLRRYLATIDHVLFPPLCEWLAAHPYDPGIEQLLSRFRELLMYADVRRFVDQVIRTTIEIQRANPKLQSKLVDILHVVIAQIKTQFLLYFPQIRAVFPHLDSEFLHVVGLLEQGLQDDVHGPELDARRGGLNASKKATPQRTLTPAQRLDVKFEVKLPNPEWEEAQWIVWSQSLFMTLMEHCGNMVDTRFRAISACDSLVQRHARIRDALYPLVFALFFFDKSSETNLADVLQSIFREDVVKNVPISVLRLFLAVMELIEINRNVPDTISQCETTGKRSEPDVVNPNNVALGAEKAHLIVQALRINEDLYEKTSSESEKAEKAVFASRIAKMIEYNQQLGLPLAARGVWVLASQRKVDTDQGIFAEKLGLWNDALETYKRTLESEPGNVQATEGKFRCLLALSKYKEIQQSASEGEWPLYQAAAYWGMGEESKFLEAVRKLQEEKSRDYLYYRALYHMIEGAKETHFEEVNKASHKVERKSHFAEVEKLTGQLRDIYAKDLFPAIGENYECVYGEFASASYASEIEEAMTYSRLVHKGMSSVPEERVIAKEEMSKMLATWKMRFAKLAAKPNVLHEIVRIRSVSFGVKEIYPEWIRFLNVAISGHEIELAENSISLLKRHNCDGLELKYIEAKLNWAKENQDEAIKYLTEVLKNEAESPILAAPELTLGLWLMENKEKNLEAARTHIQRSTQLNRAEPAAWKAWSTVNSELYSVTKDKSYLLDSLDGSLNGLMLSPDDPLPFTLKILSVLFTDHDAQADLHSRFTEKFISIPVHVWIPVLPQIIARAKDPKLNSLIQGIILAVGKEHPHVVLYSLMPPLKSNSGERNKMATAIFEQLRTLYPIIVDQILAFANELIRTAVTWWELWYTQLDESSRAYISRNNTEEMYPLLVAAHKVVSAAPETIYETMFIREFGHLLSCSEQFLQSWRKEGEDYYLFQAWALYIKVYHALKPYIESLWEIPLVDASPKLAAMRHLDIVVPGTYAYNEKPIYLESVEPVMTVMRSKQRPRRMAVRGSDGVKYTFLLKAHEDVRLDERVMQFFALLNTLMSHSKIPLKEKMSITTYEVIPLTGQVGLIGWVPDCSTVFELIKNLRLKNNMCVDIEYNYTKKNWPRFESLRGPYKLKAFREALKVTDGDELKKILLLRSDDSNHWLRRRLEYTTSLATTSMAGYILGLGDRHLCNIMMKKKSAKLVHIDFGDCFEVAMRREKFPETVPFRLTRVLENALEVSRIEGTFKTCCVNLMELMHTNSEQLIGLLQVFVYDPLLQWIESGDSSKSRAILCRIEAKLKERDPDVIAEQVTKIIDDARDHSKLCCMFTGWIPWW